jgi:hypothetical protein
MARRPKQNTLPIKYAVEYELEGATHMGLISIEDQRLHLRTQHGSKDCALSPNPDFHSLAMVLLAEIGARLVRMLPKSS